MTGIAIAEKGPFAGPNGEPVLYVEHWYDPEEIIRGILGTPPGWPAMEHLHPHPGRHDEQFRPSSPPSADLTGFS